MSSTEEIREEMAKAYHQPVSNLAGVADVQGGDKIISGEDDRKDIFQLDDNDAAEALQKKLADSTVILTNKENLVEQADGSYKLTVQPFRRNNMPACNGENFGNQNTGGWCSGFMVGKDVLITAGHCAKTEDRVKNTAFVFGFRVASDGDTGTTEFSADQVYFGSERLAQDLSDSGDFAIIRVDREITSPGAEALPVSNNDSISSGDNIGVIGYPSGLPVKIAFGKDTVVMRDNDPWLIANLDTYGGNSGSAVFNTDGQVEGILVRGARDYNIDFTNQCFLSNRISDAAGSEAVTKSSVWINKIPV